MSQGRARKRVLEEGVVARMKAGAPVDSGFLEGRALPFSACPPTI